MKCETFKNMWAIRIAAVIYCVMLVTDAGEAEGQSCPCPRHDLNGKRVKSSDSTSVYLVIDGKRRGIPNPTTYENLFKSWNTITNMDVSTIPLDSGLTDGAILAKSKDSDPVYLISNGIKRWIINPATFDAFYFQPEKIVVLPKIVVDIIPNGENIGGDPPKVSCNCPRHDLNGHLVKSSDSVSVYLVLDGIRRGIPNENTFNTLFRDWKGITIMDVNLIPLGPNLTDGATLVKSAAKTSVYLVSNGVKRGITSEQAFEKYHFGWDKIVVVPQVVVDSIPVGDNIS